MSDNAYHTSWRNEMGYPEMMRDIIEQVRREESKSKRENITMHAGVVQCDCHDHAEDLIRAANEALLKDKKESK
jgi:GGDEF domain-containing protein